MASDRTAENSVPHTTQATVSAQDAPTACLARCADTLHLALQNRPVERCAVNSSLHFSHVAIIAHPQTLKLPVTIIHPITPGVNHEYLDKPVQIGIDFARQTCTTQRAQTVQMVDIQPKTDPKLTYPQQKQAKNVNFTLGACFYSV